MWTNPSLLWQLVTRCESTVKPQIASPDNFVRVVLALSLTLRHANRASLCWALSAPQRSLSCWFLRLSLSLLLSSFWLSNVASLAISFDVYNVEILHHAQIGQNAYIRNTHVPHIYIKFSIFTMLAPIIQNEKMDKRMQLQLTRVNGVAHSAS